MCRPVRCRRCGGTTWSGCGNHVQQVMGAVPTDERCGCQDGPPPSRSTPSNAEGGRSLLDRFRRRGA